MVGWWGGVAEGKKVLVAISFSYPASTNLQNGFSTTSSK